MEIEVVNERLEQINQVLDMLSAQTGDLARLTYDHLFTGAMLLQKYLEQVQMIQGGMQ